MAHRVKCVYCGKIFDRDKVACVQVSNRRYAHKECSEGEMQRLSKEELDKQKLEEYIVKLLGADYVTARVHKQINQYVKEYQFTYSGIHKALVYFYEVQKHSTDKANGGIGIVPYVYKDAYNYYYSLWLAQQKNENKDVQSFVAQERVVRIPNPERKVKKRKLFSFLDEEEEAADGE